ncbi:MAG: phosphoribosyltransferase family protein [Chlorobium sp.]|nr:MAG: ComF family protein [Chlorobium sp.]
MFDQLLHLLFPDVCVVCRKLLLPPEEYCCSSCMDDFNPFRTPSESEQVLARVIADHSASSIVFERGWCRYQFHKKSRLQLALHAMKYEGLYNLGTMFGRQLGEWILTCKGISDIDCIVPVPLHRLKKIERSYNQSEKIAEGIGKLLQKPVKSDLLQRKRYTVSQTGLSALDRKKNPEGAFQALQGIPPCHVLLVDDIITTGATLVAAALALRQGGVEKISFAAVALAVKD